MTTHDRRAYVLISPCRDEAAYMRRTLDSVVAQTLRPAKWVIVDDGSTDATPEILAEYAARHDWIEVVAKPDRGERAVGPGVIEAFYFGLDRVDLDGYAYLCKLDLDLDLPHGYFEGLVERMEANPRIGTCSGKPYMRVGDRLLSEKCGNELSVGMSKFYRTTCFRQIGGFVREVMWDAIDCHKARQLGWIAVSWDDPELRFEHLRPMGSSQKSIHVGRRRHGFGQYYMGSDPLYFGATAVYRMAHPPYVTGGLSMLAGYIGAWARGVPQHDDPELRAFIRAYQRRALLKGKARAVAEIEAERAGLLHASVPGQRTDHADICDPHQASVRHRRPGPGQGAADRDADLDRVPDASRLALPHCRGEGRRSADPAAQGRCGRNRHPPA